MKWPCPWQYQFMQNCRCRFHFCGIHITIIITSTSTTTTSTTCLLTFVCGSCFSQVQDCIEITFSRDVEVFQPACQCGNVNAMAMALTWAWAAWPWHGMGIMHGIRFDWLALRLRLQFCVNAVAQNISVQYEYAK